MAKQVDTSLLNLAKVQEIVGEESKARLKELVLLTELSKIPLYLVGPSGSGKTATMKALLKWYAQKHNVPAYYFQLSQEDTKGSVLIGYRLVNGSLVPVKGVLARAAEEGAIVGIDEITQSTHNMLTMLNAVDGSESLIAIGDEAVSADKLKVVYGSNRSVYSANIRIPQSFANRVLALSFDYPGYEDEVAISMAVAKKDFNRPLTVPETLARYVVSYIRQMRKECGEQYPLSVRNAAKILIYCNIVLLTKQQKLVDKLDHHFVQNTSGESTKRTIYKRIYNDDPRSSNDLTSPEFIEFLKLISTVGVDKFRQIVLEACNYYVDLDGLEMLQDTVKQKLAGSII